MHIPHNKRFLTILVAIVGVIILSYILIIPFKDFFTDPGLIRDWLLGFSVMAPFMYMLLQFIQVIFSAIPGTILSVAGGYVFGPWLGTVYNLIGTMIGSLFVFWLTRRYGRRLAESFIHEKEMRHMDRFFQRQGALPLIIIRMIPFFPNDAVSFFLGLTKVSYWRYAWTSFIGFLPQFIILNMLGAEMQDGLGSPLMIILTVIMSLVGIFYVFRQKLKVILLKEIREVEHEMEVAAYFIEKESEESLDFLEKELGYHRN